MESPATGLQTDDQKSLAPSISRSSLKSSESDQAQLSKPIQWKCAYCDKLYHRQANLIKHRFIAHRKELNGIVSHAFQVNGNASGVNAKRKRDDKKRAKTIPCKRNDDVNWKMKSKPVGKNRKRSRWTYREIKPKLNTTESRSTLDSKASDTLTETNDNTESCNRLVDPTVTVPVPLESNVSEAANASGSYVFVDLQNKTDQSDAAIQNTAKLYVLNGNVVKDENTNGGLICLANNLSDIENLGIPVLNSTMSNGECNVLAVPMSTFIPFNPNLNSNVSSVTAANTNTLSAKNCDGEILRSKLSEGVPNAAPAADTMTTMVAIPITNAVAANKTAVKTKRDDVESPALVKAKNDLIKWKKLLIETAIHPQIPQFKLPTDYTGPTYSCEECDDTFISLVGLENHKNRRSVLFTYACPICEQTLEFYNRCTFLIHVRLHDATVKACFLTISTIPANRLNFEVFDDDTNFMESSAADAKNDDVMQLPHDEMPASNSSEMERLQSSPPTPVVTPEVATNAEPEGRKRKRETNELTNSKTNRKRRTLRALGLASKEEMTGGGQENSAIMETINSVVAKQFASKTSRRPTPPKKAKSTVEEITLTSSDDDDGYANDDASSRVNGNADTNAAETPTKSMVKCRECHAEVPSLTSHYRAANRPLKEFHCEQCKFFNPSKCALEAHSRMHKRAQPYVCPDCGFYFSTMDSFSTHVKQVCFYDFKTIRFKCPQCSLLKPSAPQFDDHLKRHHIGKVYKCSECNASAYLEKNIVEHIKKNVHADRPASVVEGFRCLLCPSMLVTKQSINMHVKKHVFGLEYLRYVYICKCCKKFATGQMAKFAKHYDQCVDRDDWRASSEKALKARKMKVSSSEGEETNADDRHAAKVDAAEAARLKNVVTRTKMVCAMCRVSKLNDTKSLFCKACVSSVNGENAGAADAVKNESTYRSKRRYKCKLCKKLMNRDMNTITKHYEREHRVDGDVNTKKIIDAASTDRDASRRRRSSVKSQSKNNVSSSVEQKTEAPDAVSQTTNLSEQYREVSSLPKAVAMSAFSLMSKSAALAAASQMKSSETDRKRRSSRYKITSHDRKENTRTRSVEAEQADSRKSKTSNYECMECGLSFIVRPSLEKHLIIEHKIYDVKEYYRVNNYLVDDEESDEKKKVSINQCEVCYLQCNSKQNYDKHIRTHGMAFVTMQSRAKS